MLTESASPVRLNGGVGRTAGAQSTTYNTSPVHTGGEGTRPLAATRGGATAPDVQERGEEGRARNTAPFLKQRPYQMAP